MTKTRQHLTLLSSLLLVSGCAMSAIGIDDGGELTLDDDAGIVIESPDLNPASTAPGTGVTKPTTTGPRSDAVVPRTDAAAPVVSDAGAPHQTSVPRADAGSTASKPDAAVPPRDAGRPSGIPPDAATPTNPSVGQSCKADRDCKVSCVPIGVTSCCRDDSTCGCTWVPGVYCL